MSVSFVGYCRKVSAVIAVSLSVLWEITLNKFLKRYEGLIFVKSTPEFQIVSSMASMLEEPEQVD